MDGSTAFLFFGLGVSAFIFIRNQVVFEVRTGFLRKRWEGCTVYDKLPSYEQMMGNPKHWGRWTSKQWRAYALRNEVTP